MILLNCLEQFHTFSAYYSVTLGWIITVSSCNSDLYIIIKTKHLPLLSLVSWSDFVLVASVVSDSVRPHGLWPARLLCPWDSPGNNTGVGSHVLLQGIFLTKGSNPGLLCLLRWQAGSLPLTPPGKGNPNWQPSSVFLPGVSVRTRNR